MFTQFRCVLFVLISHGFACFKTLKFRAHPGGNTPFDTVTSLQHTSLILDINVMVN